MDKFSGKRKIDERETDSGNSSMCGSEFKHLSLQRCSNRAGKVGDKLENRLILRRCSSNKSEEIETRKLFLSFRLFDGSVFWHRIDPPKTINESSSICISDAVCRIPSSVISMNCGIAAVGSKIYMLGGDHEGRNSRGSTDVLFFDSAASDSSEFAYQKEESLSLFVPRSCPTAISTHGKIYVFGSYIASNFSWGEVFDPESNRWSPLPDPPPQARRHGPHISCTAVIGDRILLFQYPSELFCFDVKSNLWEILTSIHPLLMRGICSDGIALDDNILLSHRTASVQAYDFSAKKWLKVKGLGMKRSCLSHWEDIRDGFVVRLGENTFCVVWSDEDAISKTYVQCVSFRLARVNNSKGTIKFFRAEVVGRSAYLLPPGGKYLMGCFSL